MESRLLPHGGDGDGGAGVGVDVDVAAFVEAKISGDVGVSARLPPTLPKIPLELQRAQ
jgi:hypothetical protein